MKIGMIDVDGHRWPNLALMKLSAWHKAQGDRVPSFLRWWHDENAVALTAMLDAYIRLNMLERLSMEMTGKTLKNLIAENGKAEVDEKKMFRVKYQAREKEKREAKS